MILTNQTIQFGHYFVLYGEHNIMFNRYVFETDAIFSHWLTFNHLVYILIRGNFVRRSRLKGKIIYRHVYPL